MAKRNFRSELNAIDWDFTGENGGGFSAYHWYPARFVPQLAGILIGYFSEPGETVLDPFVGSGTTLVEAYKLGRLGIGIDLNPIAALIARAKLTAVDQRGFSSYLRGLAERARAGASLGLAERHSHELPKRYEELQAWYHPATLADLVAIWTALRGGRKSRYRDVGLAAFSSVLKSCSSQDQHWGWVCDNVRPRDLVAKPAMERFRGKLLEFARASQELEDEAAVLQETPVDLRAMRVLTGDAITEMASLPAGAVDLVVTSPPYFSMTDYVLSQRLSNLWFDFDMDALRGREIGARYRRFRKGAREEYLHEIRSAVAGVARLLRRGRFACFVLGESPRRGPVLDTFAEICLHCGFRVREVITRRVSPRRTLSPSLDCESVFLCQRR
ncbi:MAG: site-specific DNA-methyltransferase [Thermoanaerobaculia bacterium]|nr:site-specific DNA-methyltransferase [Thermoanaerobaculia bacterium]